MNISELLRSYNKEEVLELANELELDITEAMSSKTIVNDILSDLASNGLPADDDMTDLMEDFLIDAGILSEDGEELEWILPKEDQPASIPVTVVQQPEATSIDVTRVPCYGFADQRAPECNRCVLFNQCMEIRLVFRAQMACFGMYDSNDAQCRTCLEAGPCRIATAEQV